MFAIIMDIISDVIYSKYFNPIVDIHVEAALKIVTTPFEIDLLYYVDHLHLTSSQPS